jgi:hypothetical protein
MKWWVALPTTPNPCMQLRGLSGEQRLPIKHPSTRCDYLLMLWVGETVIREDKLGCVLCAQVRRRLLLQYVQSVDSSVMDTFVARAPTQVTPLPRRAPYDPALLRDRAVTGPLAASGCVAA